MRAALEDLIQQGAVICKQSEVLGQSESSKASNQETSPPMTQSSIREDNTRMAMTRENSVEPAQTGDQGVNGSVTVEEPMGSLYEVTRLRNIRNNIAKTVQFQSDGGGEPKDFISRGVILLPEAEDLYKR